MLKTVLNKIENFEKKKKKVNNPYPKYIRYQGISKKSQYLCNHVNL